MNLAECGVCDGLTIYFAIKACEMSNIAKKAFLYDSWETLADDKYSIGSNLGDAPVAKTK